MAEQNYIFQRSSIQCDANQNILVHSSNSADAYEDCRISDEVFKDLKHMLLEEDIEENISTFLESAALQEGENSFREVLQVPDLNNGILGSGTDQNMFVHSSNCADYSSEDYGIIDEVFKYIYHMLLEVDVEENVSMIQESADLQEAVNSFREVLQVPDLNLGILGSEQNYVAGECSYRTTTIMNKCLANLQINSSVEVASTINSSQLPDNDGLMNSSESTLQSSLMQLQEGVAEMSRKILPDENENYRLKGKKKLRDDDDLEQGRNNKQPAVYTEPVVLSESFDMVLLNDNISTVTDCPSKGYSNRKKSRVKKKHGGKRNVIDLRSLLMICAQAICADDRTTANTFLKQIRQHSSPTGDGMERLAHYFANGLEGRMVGSGTQFYRDIITFPVSPADLLKTYQIYLDKCPYWKISIFFSNNTICKVAENASQLHIVDFGILYGFQWPSLLKKLSFRPGGPPKLRITGIDSPHPGFKPSKRVEETGLRLAKYAETFNVPFEFHAIAKKWETIKIQELGIREDEVLIVNCLYRLRSLLDETVVIDNSPREYVMNLIKDMKPHTFILGTVNGPCNAPFIVTRFREAMLHYSSFFDMMEVNFPHETQERMMLETVFYAKEAINIIACEGVERVERPESYRQWNVINHRYGFRKRPLEDQIIDAAREMLKAYHKDFVVEQDGHWLLQGWKGRIVYGLSCWKLGTNVSS